MGCLAPKALVTAARRCDDLLQRSSSLEASPTAEWSPAPPCTAHVAEVTSGRLGNSLGSPAPSMELTLCEGCGPTYALTKPNPTLLVLARDSGFLDYKFTEPLVGLAQRLH